MTVKVGDILEGKYEVVRHIGEGAWGDVFEGRNQRVHKRVAIKILKDSHKGRSDIVERFEREARAATKIESAHVVQVYDAGVLADGERPYMVMEYLDGCDLGVRIKERGRLGGIEAAEFVMQAARGLADAHEAEVLHRDMKPENIFIVKTRTGDEIAKIVDFGISKLVNPELSPSSVTQTGAILGSPVYMSPEQARGARQSDARSDVYSLGIVLYECLTGRTPFDAQSFNELMFKIALEDAPDVRAWVSDIDAELAEITKQCVARDPEKRFQSALEVADRLVDWLRAHGANVPDWRRSSGGGTRTASSTSQVKVNLPPPAQLPHDATASGNLRASLAEPAPSSRHPASALVMAPTEAPPPVKKKRTVTIVFAACAAAIAVGVVAIGIPRGGRVATASNAAPDVPAVRAPEPAGASSANAGASGTAASPTTIQTTPAVAASALNSSGTRAAARDARPAPFASERPTTASSQGLVAAPKPSVAPSASSVAGTPSASKPATVGGRAIQTEL